MENLPTELFLARILHPAVYHNEEGNIILLPLVFLFARCHPPSPLLRFPLSLIESSNFRLHSPSACLLCRPVRIQRTLCRNLGTSAEGCIAPVRIAGWKEGRDKKKERKIKNQNAELSYSYRDWEKSSLRKDERLAQLPSRKNSGSRDLSFWKMIPNK